MSERVAAGLLDIIIDETKAILEVETKAREIFAPMRYSRMSSSYKITEAQEREERIRALEIALKDLDRVREKNAALIRAGRERG